MSKKVKFFNDAGKIRKELLDKEAFDVARSFFSVGRQHNNPNMVSSSQLRRFYNDVKDIEKKLEYGGNSKEKWIGLLPLVKMIKAKVAYATSDSKIKPSERGVYRKFKEFITDCVDSVETEEDYKAFCKYFEAVVGYYYGEGGK